MAIADILSLTSAASARASVAAPTPDYAAFKRDPESTVLTWQEVTRADVSRGLLTSEYRITRIFDKMTPAQRNECVRYMLSNYSFQLDVPKGKIKLHEVKAQLEEIIRESAYLKSLPSIASRKIDVSTKLDEVNVFKKHGDFSAQDLIVLVFSISGIRKYSPTGYNEKPPLPPDAGLPPEVLRAKLAKMFSTSAADKAKKADSNKSCADEDQMALFRNGEACPIDNAFVGEVNRPRTATVIDIVSLLNPFMPKDPVGDVALTYSRDGSFYHPRRGKVPQHIEITLRSPDIRKDTAHEMAHALYEYIQLGGSSLDEETIYYFREIFMMDPGSAFKPVDESSQVRDARDAYGHPTDNDSELFSSATSTFVTSPEQWLVFINDRETPEKTRTVNKLLYCYLRDNVFKGVFAADDNGVIRFHAKGTPEYEKHNLMPEQWKDMKKLVPSPRHLLDIGW